jgi:hypothetical protein
MQLQSASWKEVYAEAESRTENSILSECISIVIEGTENDRAKRYGERMSRSAWKNTRMDN